MFDRLEAIRSLKDLSSIFKRRVFKGEILSSWHHSSINFASWEVILDE